MARRALLSLTLMALLLSPSGALFAQDAAPKARGVASASELSALSDAIEQALADPKLDGTRVGVHVVDLETGQELYAREADKRFNPASNIKLITSAAALDVFGPNRTFTTRVIAGAVEGGVVKRGLHVHGEGAGFLLHEDVLDWAAAIKARGITRVEGGVTIDGDPFTGGDYLPPGYEQKSEDASYRAPIGPVSINYNATTVTVLPARAGQPAVVRLDPPNGHVQVANTAKTVAGSGRKISIKSVTIDDGAGTRIEVEGTIGEAASPWSKRKRVDNPPLYAGAILERALEDMGVEVEGEIRQGEALEEGVTLVTHNSNPLIYVVMAMNKWSNNFMAEQLLRDLSTVEAAGAKRGTWAGGIAVASDFLKRAGVDPESFKLHNGSGLYRGNFVTPRAFTTLLRHMHQHVWSHEYKASLAISGVDGTLAGRLRGESTRGRVRGKTGTLNEVSALSGYARTRGGREVAFVILFNDPPIRAWRLRSQQDAVARAIVEWGG